MTTSAHKASPWGEAGKNLWFLTDEVWKTAVTPHPPLTRSPFPSRGRLWVAPLTNGSSNRNLKMFCFRVDCILYFIVYFRIFTGNSPWHCPCGAVQYIRYGVHLRGLAHCVSFINRQEPRFAFTASWRFEFAIYFQTFVIGRAFMPAKIRCDDPKYIFTISHMGLMRHLLSV